MDARTRAALGRRHSGAAGPHKKAERHPPALVCECYHDCRDCTLSGDWHVHERGECPVHPQALVTGEG